MDVAARAGVSRATVSRVERGQVGTLTVDLLRRVLAVLEIRLDIMPRWRGGELDRMLNAGHAALHEAAAELFRQLSGWLVAVEVTFAIYGERGAIDILAFHPASGSLLVVELKTDLVDVQALIGAVDRYRRLAPQIARERGWKIATVSVWVALRDTDTNRRRVNAHGAVLGGAFPTRGAPVRRWLRRPAGTMAGLSFLADSRPRSVIAKTAGVQRIRRR